MHLETQNYNNEIRMCGWKHISKHKITTGNAKLQHRNTKSAFGNTFQNTKLQQRNTKLQQRNTKLQQRNTKRAFGNTFQNTKSQQRNTNVCWKHICWEIFVGKNNLF